MRIVLILVFLSSLQLTAQDISFSTEIRDSTIHIEEDSELVSKLMFYVSDLQLETKDGEFLEMDSYYLIDFKDSRSLLLKNVNLDKKEIKSIQFKLGIDSITNVSGAFGGALDPTKGMYWSWQNGYINFKMEGNVNDEDYVLHLGGYMSHFKSVQQVVLPVLNRSIEFKIILPLNELLEKVIPEDNTVMSPSLEAVAISKRIASTFYLK